MNWRSLMIKRLFALLAAWCMFTLHKAEGAPLTFAFVETDTSSIAARLTLFGEQPYNSSNVELLSFTNFGATVLTARLLESTPSLVGTGFFLPAGRFTGRFLDISFGSVTLDPGSTKLVSYGAEVASMLSTIPLPLTGLAQTASLSLLFEGSNTEFAYYKIRIAPLGGLGGSISGEWWLIPEPSSVALASLGGLVVLRLRK
jgi:hypothetical protein